MAGYGRAARFVDRAAPRSMPAALRARHPAAPASHDAPGPAMGTGLWSRVGSDQDGRSVGGSDRREVCPRPALTRLLKAAELDGRRHIDISAGELHRTALSVAIRSRSRECRCVAAQCVRCRRWATPSSPNGRAMARSSLFAISCRGRAGLLPVSRCVSLCVPRADDRGALEPEMLSWDGRGDAGSQHVGARLALQLHFSDQMRFPS